jgi:glycosyltransferase involved in cell wall biosynthesis
VRACTVVARNYLPQARVLAQSLAEQDGGRLSVLILDNVEAGADRRNEPFDVIDPGELDLTRRQFHLMATIYDLLELATAVKPWLLDLMLDHTGESVCYLDPDMEVFGSLDEVKSLADRHGIVLTPHLTEPMPRDGLFPDETYILRAGTYNLGFIAVSPGSGDFRHWWRERLRRHCRIAVEEGLFVDQRWIDFVPSLFDHAVLRDPGYNVAYWNVATRPISRDGSRFMVGDRPLRLFHFSGFSPLRPHLLSRHQGSTPRVHLADRPVLARICSRYAKKVLDAGFLEAQGHAYRLDWAANGLSIDHRMRNAFRLDLQEAEELQASGNGSGPGPWLPDPFDPVEAPAFFRMMLERPEGRTDCVVPRYFEDLHQSRADLQIAFPALEGTGEGTYFDWVERVACLEGSVPRHYLPPWRPAHSRLVRPSCEPLDPGVNVIGYLDAEDGVGEVARQFGRVLAHAAIPHALVPYHQTPSRLLARMPAAAADPHFDINLICVNADELPTLFSRMADGYHRPHATVAVWAWEVAAFPEWMRLSDYFVDEIWVYSDHAARAIAPMTDKPVVVVPPPVVLSDAPRLNRSELGLPEGFLFLFCFSYLSVFERKNPIAVIEAFKRAFRPDEGPQLVIKSIHGWLFANDRARLRAATAGRSDIHLIDAYESSDRQRALLASCDVYVSLHRAEGYGLTMAEAMTHGKPVIGTGYSGNLEFMNEENSLLVPFTLQPIPHGCDPYPPGTPWAEPDIDAAADLMVRLTVDPELAARTGARARQDMATFHTPAARAKLVTARLDGIRSRAS